MIPPVFRWTKSANADAPNGDAIRYVVCVGREGSPVDSVAAATDTSWAAAGMEIGSYRWKVRAVDAGGLSVWAAPDTGYGFHVETSGVDGEDQKPKAFQLRQNYPNPFNPLTEIKYSVPQRGKVRIEIYALSGRRIRTLVDGTMPPGERFVTWDGTDESGRRVVSGVYLCRMTAGEFTRTIKMTVMK
jgi:hypothetical protein